MLSDAKDVKLTKQSHAYKGYASTYNFEISNSFNPELQFKGTESTIRNKLIDFLPELNIFKFVDNIDFRVLKKHEIWW